MQLNSLSISRLRNLHSIDLTLRPHFNIFYGENGGGKTSLLEAVHLLTLGRSFRARQPRQMITFGEESCIVSGTISSRNTENRVNSIIRLGVERFRTGGIKIRLADQDCQSIGELAKTLPIQLINSDSYDILEASPQFRRQFLDWTMFHVEHSFYSVWQRFKQVLQQRNAALKEARVFPDSSIRVWDKEFVEMGEVMDIQRKGVLKDLAPIFSEIVNGLLDLKKKITLRYQSGWDVGSLQEAIERSLERDRAWGYTTVGPQRADLELLIGGVSAKNVLSRGQLKLFICALLMARATLLYKSQGRRCVFLIDDLNSELDKGASKLLIQTLAGLGAQVLVTSVEAEPLAKLLEGQDCAMYAVQNGQIIQNYD